MSGVVSMSHVDVQVRALPSSWTRMTFGWPTRRSWPVTTFAVSGLTLGPRGAADSARMARLERDSAPIGFAMELMEAPVPDAFRSLRRFAMDDAVLLFDRTTGLNVLCDGPEFVGLRQVCPRVVQFGITNRCNLACEFCSRDLTIASEWTAESAFVFLRGLADRGVLEVAFGGGEPFVFPGFVELVRRLHDETPLAVNITTNGLRLRPEVLNSVAPSVGQLRLSMYDDNDWRNRVAELARSDVRFGVNYLVTPRRLADLELVVLELVGLGCADILLLSYNGPDSWLHLGADELSRLDEAVDTLSKALTGRARICLDVCWGSRLERTPTLFDDGDCGAGREFIVVTSDRHVMPCSFHDLRIPIETVDELMAVWETMGHERLPATQPGCARVPGFGLGANHSIPVSIGARP